MGRLYALAMPILAATGLAGALVMLLLAPLAAVGSPLFALCVASAVAVASRVLLIAYLDVSAIPNVGILYLASAARS